MPYVDGFVVAVPTSNKEIYKQHAEAAAIVFKEYGALKLVECWGNKFPIQHGQALFRVSVGFIA